MLGYRDAQILDITGPLEIFSRASRWLMDHGYTATPAYSVELITPREAQVTCSSGLQLIASRIYHEVHHADTLLISGGIGFQPLLKDGALLSWIQYQAKRSQRIGSICTGAFLLGAAGLLENRRATTHWAYCDLLAQQNPQTQVDPDAIYIREGNIYTSAGVTTGMDMCLAMVEEDWGQKVALAVARELVMFLKRPASHSQLSPFLNDQSALTDRMNDIQYWILEHVDSDLSVNVLAERVAMSPRNFARRFTERFGETPARYVEKVRVEAALIWLEETDQSIDAIARRCGFSSAEIMRRAFLRVIGHSPQHYRQKPAQYRKASPAIHKQ